MKVFYKLKSFLLTIFGDIKVFKWPMFLVYYPYTFRCRANEYRMALHYLQEGDLIFRKYDDYLDGKFIPGPFSHGAIYIGDRTIIHSTAEGVHEIDLLDYLRCDKFCILRPNRGQKIAIKRAKNILGKEYDFDFKSTDKRFYCFEVCAYCYKGAHVKELKSKIFGFIPTFPAFIAESFLTNKNFELIYSSK